MLQSLLNVVKVFLFDCGALVHGNCGARVHSLRVRQAALRLGCMLRVRVEGLV